MQYLERGKIEFQYSIIAGLIIYLTILGVLWVTKKRGKIEIKKSIFELLFVIYVITLLEITGIIGMKFYIADVFKGLYNSNLIPFYGSSLLMILLNFLLFVPYGIVIPVVFKSQNIDWKKILLIGFVTTLTIEFLQLFGGRYAEIDDVLANTFGTLVGFILYTVLKNVVRKKGIYQFFLLVFMIGVSFFAISFLCNNKVEQPDGLDAIDTSCIAEVNVYHNGNKIPIGTDSNAYGNLPQNLSNCAGHIIEINNIHMTLEDLMKDDGYYIEVIFTKPQTIHFENNSKFILENADSLMFDSNEYMLYWSTEKGIYTNQTYYMKLDSELSKHQADIEHNFDGLKEALKKEFT